MSYQSRIGALRAENQEQHLHMLVAGGRAVGGHVHQADSFTFVANTTRPDIITSRDRAHIGTASLLETCPLRELNHY